MSLDDVLRVIEKDVRGRRDPEKYHFSIFGEPSEEGTWGYRIGRHHVSLHFTVVKGRAVGNPTMLGSNPAEVRSGPLAGLRVLGAEEDKGRALLNALTPDQKKIAIVSEKAYPDILTENTRKAAAQGQPSGLSAARMTPGAAETAGCADGRIRREPAGRTGPAAPASESRKRPRTCTLRGRGQPRREDLITTGSRQPLS